MTLNPQREEKNIQPLLRNLGFFNFQIFFFKMAAAGSMVDFSKKFINDKML